MKKIALFLLTLIFTSYPLYAFSAEPDFINNPELWYETDTITTVEIKDANKITGIYSYYSDTARHRIFLRIVYEEISLTNEYNDIKAEFNISNENHSYCFTVNENGLTDKNSKINSAFTITQNFGFPSEQGHEIYLGIEFKDKQDIKCNNILSFSLNINGNNYNICKGIFLPYFIEETTKTPGADEKTSTSADNITQHTTKQNKLPVSDQKHSDKETDKTTESTTKFKYIPSGSQKPEDSLWNYENTSSEAEDFSDEENEYFENADNTALPNIIIPSPEIQSSLSPSAKALIAGAVLLIAAGLSIIIYCCFKPAATKHTESEHAEETTDES